MTKLIFKRVGPHTTRQGSPQECVKCHNAEGGTILIKTNGPCEDDNYICLECLLKSVEKEIGSFKGHWSDCATNNAPAFKAGKCNCLRIYKDGNQWCCLLGEDLQTGIAGFGNTVNLAVYHWWKNYLNLPIGGRVIWI